MNTPQYLLLRSDAIRNAGLLPNLDPSSVAYAPDLLLFDIHRNVNYNDLFLGGHGAVRHVQVELSSGNRTTNFLLGMGYNGAGIPQPGDLSDNKTSLHLNVNQFSRDRKLSITLSSTYLHDVNNLYTGNTVPYLTLPPDYPALHDSTGKLVWVYKGYPLQNVYSFLQDSYKAKADNLLNHLLLEYQFLPDLYFRLSVGNNLLTSNEDGLIPDGSLPSYSSSTNSSSLASNTIRSWIAEPQAEYKRKLSLGEVDLLAGGTLQNNNTTSAVFSGTDFPNDRLLNNLSQAANSIRPVTNQAYYKYAALFGRISYNYKSKYLVSLNGRRDGSSRFGPDKQYGNFGSIGAAWIFSNEKWAASIPFLSFGKLRGSYGTSGNDAVGDYKYLNLYSSYSRSYLGNPTLVPSALYNPDYSWQLNKEWEANVDLSFKESLSLSVTYYSNTCGNQLVQYALPGSTGFGSVLGNFPGVVKNSGWEVTVNSENIKTRLFSWTTSVNISFPVNRLLRFPGLSSSPYAGSYLVGQSLSVFGGFRYLGVDPKTGVYLFADAKGQPTSSPSTSTDYQPNLGNLDPRYYGGIDNKMTYKKWEAGFFFDFKKQEGLDYLFQLAAQQPGIYSGTDLMNFPKAGFNYWRKFGDHGDFAQPDVDPNSKVYQSAAILGQYNSSAKYGDASFIRLKNFYISYNLSQSLVRRWHLKKFRVYVQGENLFMFTAYKGLDPENQNFLTLPSLRTLTGGISMTF